LSEYNSLRLAINRLRDVNVATVIAAGNNGYRNAMAAPACLTPAISVASSDKSDQVASFSNISPLTTLIAPGRRFWRLFPKPTSPIYQSKGGTSMAAPHVAGAIATFKEAQPECHSAPDHLGIDQHRPHDYRPAQRRLCQRSDG
jgi:subtilisin family serine protease